jgi:3-oxoacyl-[acyl-carrier-protein] synthase III
MNATIKSVAVGFPKNVRTNEWFREKYPDIVAQGERTALAKMFNAAKDGNEFDDGIAKFMADPFRGTVERRILADDADPITLQRDTALSALAAAKCAVEDIDMMLVSSFPSTHIHLGDAAWLANALGVKVPAVNVESTCSGALASLQMASALVSSGQAERVLVVVSCIYSRTCDWSDTQCWFLGDGVGAYVVERAESGGEEGFKAFHSVSTAEACGAFEYRLEDTSDGPRARIRANAPAGKVLRNITPKSIKDACAGAAKKANVTLDEIDSFVSNTAVAWFTRTFADSLGMKDLDVVDTYPEFANIGPALNPVNLHRALSTGAVQPGDLVMLFAIGSVSNATACVMRVGDVAIGDVVEL